MRNPRQVGREDWDRKLASDYTIIWFCATREETAAALACLDRRHKEPTLPSPSDTFYRYGEIEGEHGVHNLVVVAPNTSGKVSMVKAASQVKQNFPNINYHFFVGIAGGLPGSSREGDPANVLQRGDVVVAQATSDAPHVLQYDYANYHDQDIFKPKHRADKPASNLQSLFDQWWGDYEDGDIEAQSILNNLIKKDRRFEAPEPSQDLLFQPENGHIGPEGDCSECMKIFSYRPRADQKKGGAYLIKVHRGPIVTGDPLIRSARFRENIKSQPWGCNALCVDMESAALMDDFHPLIIRGISDYADSHYGWNWTEYAAATAAAVAKSMILRLQAREPHIPAGNVDLESLRRYRF
jgi:nucleoside phosphorylase